MRRVHTLCSLFSLRFIHHSEFRPKKTIKKRTFPRRLTPKHRNNMIPKPLQARIPDIGAHIVTKLSPNYRRGNLNAQSSSMSWTVLGDDPAVSEAIFARSTGVLQSTEVLGTD